MSIFSSPDYFPDFLLLNNFTFPFSLCWRDLREEAFLSTIISLAVLKIAAFLYKSLSLGNWILGAAPTDFSYAGLCTTSAPLRYSSTWLLVAVRHLNSQYLNILIFWAKNIAYEYAVCFQTASHVANTSKYSALAVKFCKRCNVYILTYRGELLYVSIW